VVVNRQLPKMGSSTIADCPATKVAIAPKTKLAILKHLSVCLSWFLWLRDRSRLDKICRRRPSYSMGYFGSASGVIC